MRAKLKRKLFAHYQKSAKIAGVESSKKDSLLCPLCWAPTHYTQLSLEHVVPESVGGKVMVLTCSKCNSVSGTKLDSHLAAFQRTSDAFRGHGVLRTKLYPGTEKEAVAELHWDKGKKNFKIIPKATNPRCSAQILRDLQSGGDKELKLSISYGYNLNSLNAAVLRAAYLILFKVFGYEYAVHEVVQKVRRRIFDNTLGPPTPGALVFSLRELTPPVDHQHFVFPGNINGVEFFLVIIRIRMETDNHWGAFLPVPVARSDEFFDMVARYRKEHEEIKFKVPWRLMFG